MDKEHSGGWKGISGTNKEATWTKSTRAKANFMYE